MKPLLWVGLFALHICSACTSPSTDYNHDLTISDEQGRPRDSTVFYFPATDSLPPNYIPPGKRGKSYTLNEQTMNCAFELHSASYCLTYFNAPVLSSFYLGTPTYRFLWLRSFHRPILLTLRRTAKGAALQTQLLNKFPGFMEISVFHPDDLPASASAEERARAKHYYDSTMADPDFQAQVAAGKRRAVQVKNEETVRPVSLQQYQAFEQRLHRANFWQLSSCQPDMILDGARWILESHQAEGYHMVNRHSPKATDGYRQACEYLLDLSSVRDEERY